MPGRHVPEYEVARRPGARPILIFDGECGFCRLWIERWRARTGDAIEYAPYQEAAGRYPEIPREAFERSVVYVEPEGAVWSGAAAAVRSLASVPSGRKWLTLYGRLPGFAGIAEAIYAYIAGHRRLFSKLTRLLWGTRVFPPGYFLARSLFLRLTGATYLVAFLSLWAQVDGLIGSRGILPAAPWLDSLAERLGPERFLLLPTLCWLDASDPFLHLLCGAGALLSCLVILGLLPRLCLAFLWILYLSLAGVCRTFLNFQWDLLLLESGFLAILLAPAGPRCALLCPRPPPRAAFALLRWLLFRLMFASGVVKLSSWDPSWWGLSALSRHYETQPLPTWTSWYAHQLPAWFQSACVAIMFVIELGAPFLIAAPRRPRYIACGALVTLQVLIAATGNYGFFNLLALSLCVLLIDDDVWPRRLREGLRRARESASVPVRLRWRSWAVAPLACVIALLGAVHLAGAFRVPIEWPSPIASLVRSASPFRSVNGYGLFSIMTMSRPEIVVEGSEDGRTWLAYEFRWKPGDTERRPAFMAPHMPRLDWQMWFAALGDYRSTPWFQSFVGRLLEGSPPTLALLGRNPFPDHPPRYVRALLYEYRFTRAGTPEGKTAWWSRELKGPYSPVLSLTGN